MTLTSHLPVEAPGRLQDEGSAQETVLVDPIGISRKSGEIKFRAWDGKEMVTDDLFIGADGRAHRWVDYDLWDKPQYILMQYTGLKDKNGVEIYEGDVVRRRDRVWTISFDQREADEGSRIPIKDREYGEAIGKVVWDSEYAAFEVDLIKGEKCSFYGPDGVNFAFEELEVIGNIYENPELLESLSD